MLSLLPGDHLYPASPDYTGSPATAAGPEVGQAATPPASTEFPGSLAESRGEGGNLNRLEFRDQHDCRCAQHCTALDTTLHCTGHNTALHWTQHCPAGRW